MQKYNRYIIMLSDKDRHILKTLAAQKQTSLSQLVREAISFALLNLWLPTKKGNDYE